MRYPGEGHEFHRDVGFGGFKRDRFEWLIERIDRDSKGFGLRLKLGFKVGQLLLER